MIRVLVEMAATVAAVPLCAYFLPGVSCADKEFAIMAGLLLAFIYLLLRPVVRLLTGWLGCITFGFANIAVDAGLVMLCAVIMKDGFQVASFWWALAAAAIINVTRGLLGSLFKKR